MTPEIIEYLVPGAKCLTNYEMRNGEISWWDESLGPRPTEQQIADAIASPEYQAWRAEHGGDPELTARRRIRESLDTDTGKVLKALVLEMIARGVINATPAQVLQAITDRINAGQVD